MEDSEKRFEDKPGNQEKSKAHLNRLVEAVMELMAEERRIQAEKPPIIDRVDEDYYFAYHSVANGWGGYHPVNLTFNHDGKGLHRQITDDVGRFLEFPGVVEGRWRRALALPFREQMDFVFNTGMPSNENDLLSFYWTVQPDGQYFMDEDGFGMENGEEIVLVTGMDREGRFTGPFRESD